MEVQSQLRWPSSSLPLTTLSPPPFFNYVVAARTSHRASLRFYRNPNLTSHRSCFTPFSDIRSNATFYNDDVDSVETDIEILGNNRRRILAKVAVNASLENVWQVLTDYERLADFIPGLAVSQLLDKKPNFARLLQVAFLSPLLQSPHVASHPDFGFDMVGLCIDGAPISRMCFDQCDCETPATEIGEQDLAFGLKFKAKGVVDCYEKDVEHLPIGQRRDIEFEMVEGDFKTFAGKWSIEQCKTCSVEEGGSSVEQSFDTTLFYIVDVEPKLWLPVHLIEGRLCNEIKINLRCVREEAQKAYLSSY